MTAGRFNSRLTLQARSASVDGAGQPVDAWSDVGAVWADVRSVSGLAAIKADAGTSVNKVSIRLRYRADVVSSMRLTAPGVVYKVQAVLPDTVGRRHVDLVCEVVR